MTLFDVRMVYTLLSIMLLGNGLWQTTYIVVA